MARTNQHFGIIKKLKNIVQKTGTVFFRSGKDRGITEEIARKIQKSAYESLHAKRKEAFTPPYKQIAEQLQVSDDMIYRAAVCRLADIAANEEKLSSDILGILELQLQNEKRTQEQLDYVQTKIDFVKKASN